MTSIPRFEFRAPGDRNLSVEVANIEDKNVLLHFAQAPRRNDYYIIFLIVAGAGIYYIDFEQYLIQPNMLFCIAPGQVHYWQLETAIQGKVILFTRDFLTTSSAYGAVQFPEDFTIFNWETVSGFSIPDPQQRRLLTFVDMMSQEYQNADGFQQELAIQSALWLFLVQAQRVFTRETIESTNAAYVLFRQYKTLINQQFWNLHHVNDYAEHLGVTSGHLSDTVRDLTGSTALSFIHQRITLEAKRLLVHTNDPASSIASALSFSDASYFGRFFKREVGETPNQFRHKFR